MQDLRTESLPDSPDIDLNRQTSPTTNATSSLATPSLPWSDASIHSFLDNDTSIRDALVVIYEGSRLIKRSSADPINPQIADLYGACAIHIEEMSSVRILSCAHHFLADVMFKAFRRRFDVLPV
jgi:hypothetical protein